MGIILLVCEQVLLEEALGGTLSSVFDEIEINVPRAQSGFGRWNQRTAGSSKGSARKNEKQNNHLILFAPHAFAL